MPVSSGLSREATPEQGDMVCQFAESCQGERYPKHCFFCDIGRGIWLSKAGSGQDSGKVCERVA